MHVYIESHVAVALPTSTIPVVLPASERHPRVSETFHLISFPTRHVELRKCTKMIKCHDGRDLGPLLVPDLPQARVICVKQHLQGGCPPRRPLCQPSEAAEQTPHFHSLKRSCTPALARGDQPMLERPKIPGGEVSSMADGDHASCLAVVCWGGSLECKGWMRELNLNSVLRSYTDPGRRPCDGWVRPAIRFLGLARCRTNPTNSTF